MRAIVVQRLGPPEVLELVEVPVPEPGPGQVLVRLQATGVNVSDTERRRGVYANLRLPWTPGLEGAGEVVAAGPGVEPARVGQRVAFFAMPPAVSTVVSFRVQRLRNVYRSGSRMLSLWPASLR